MKGSTLDFIDVAGNRNRNLVSPEQTFHKQIYEEIFFGKKCLHNATKRKINFFLSKIFPVRGKNDSQEQKY